MIHLNDVLEDLGLCRLHQAFLSNNIQRIAVVPKIASDQVILDLLPALLKDQQKLLG